MSTQIFHLKLRYRYFIGGPMIQIDENMIIDREKAEDVKICDSTKINHKLRYKMYFLLY